MPPRTAAGGAHAHTSERVCVCVCVHTSLWVCSRAIGGWKGFILECMTTILPRSAQTSQTFYMLPPAPDYLCAYKHRAEQKSSFNGFYYSGRRCIGDRLLICKWCTGRQVRNISRCCCWFQTRFYSLWAWNYTTQAVCDTRKPSDFVTSWWHLEVSKTIVPKIHKPNTAASVTNLSCSARNGFYSSAEQGRGEYSSVCLRLHVH